MTKQVLDVGNCGFDHGSVKRLLSEQFDADVVQVHTSEEALAALREGRFDLALINRRFDRDGDDGVALIRAIKEDDALAGQRVMLISNFADSQQEAVEAGAEPGFGKAELRAASTLEKLGRVLG